MSLPLAIALRVCAVALLVVSTYAAAQAIAYVPNERSGTISLIDTRTDEVV
jgi:hypothetical protein